MDSGVLIMATLAGQRVLDVVKITMENHKKRNGATKLVDDYDTPFASQKILNIVMSYVDLINEKVWFKPKKAVASLPQDI